MEELKVKITILEEELRNERWRKKNEDEENNRIRSRLSELERDREEIERENEDLLINLKRKEENLKRK